MQTHIENLPNTTWELIQDNINTWTNNGWTLIDKYTSLDEGVLNAILTYQKPNE